MKTNEKATTLLLPYFDSSSSVEERRFPIPILWLGLQAEGGGRVVDGDVPPMVDGSPATGVTGRDSTSRTVMEERAELVGSWGEVKTRWEEVTGEMEVLG